MIGPSSSHTAGVVRIARAAIKILGDIPEQAEITFYNSFARTYEGHGSDRAIIAGLMDFKTDDQRIRESLEIAQGKGIKYQFKSVGNASALHPNSIRLRLTKGNRTVEVLGESKGGGGKPPPPSLQVAVRSGCRRAGCHRRRRTARGSPQGLAPAAHSWNNSSRVRIPVRGKAWFTT